MGLQSQGYNGSVLAASGCCYSTVYWLLLQEMFDDKKPSKVGQILEKNRVETVLQTVLKF